MSKYLLKIHLHASSFTSLSVSLWTQAEGQERSILQFDLVSFWSFLQSEEQGHSCFQPDCCWRVMVRSSPASENMEINVNLASASEDTRDNHMQTS